MKTEIDKLCNDDKLITFNYFVEIKKNCYSLVEFKTILLN